MGWYGEIGGTSRDISFSNSAVTRNQWNHIAVTYDGSSLLAYVNGQLTDTVSDYSGELTTNNNDLVIGNRSAGDRALDGILDELRLWNTARSGAEIRANMHRELTGGEAGLVAYYRFNQQNTAAVDDLTANGNDGTLANDPTWVVSTVPWFSLTATAGEQGAIAPAGEVYAARNGTTNFVITPDAYWHVADVTTNSGTVGAVTGFTWSNITADGTIHADFAADLATNGTPHWWLAQYGWTNDFDQAETNNPDCDPFTTGEEYIADTDPNNSNDWFRITAISNLSPATVYFDSSSNRQYVLLWSTNLVEGIWTTSETRMGTGGLDSMNGTNNVSPEFFKLQVDVP